MSRFDVIIVGGGLVGASLANALRGTPLTVALIEAIDPASATPPSFDDRGLALSVATQRILAGMGVWQAVRASATPIESIHVSERGRFGATRIHARDFNLPALAHVVPARELGATLTRARSGVPGCTLFCPARVVHTQAGTDAVRVTVEQNHETLVLQAALIVVADGAKSDVRKQLGVAVRERDYGQVAIVANIQTSRSHQRVAYERFSPEGPIAVMPLAGDRCGLINVLPTTAADAAMRLPDCDYLRAARDRFGGRLGEFVSIGRRSRYPLSLDVAERIAGCRFVIAGNAAHTLHPNAAQGLNLGIRDVAALSGLLHEASKSGADVGGESVTKEYARICRADHRRTICLTDMLPRLFYNDWLPHSMLRALGMTAIELLPPLKAELFRVGSGLRGSHSPLLQGLAL